MRTRRGELDKGNEITNLNITKMANDLHQKVFEFLETYRNSNPDFFYWFRERNTNGRLDKGLWFQGTEHYAFIGLYDRSGGTNMTRSFGIVFNPVDGKIGCSLEIVFNEEKDQRILDFYHNAVEKIGGLNAIGTTKFQKVLSIENGFYEAEKFLMDVKPQIDQLIKDLGLQDLLFITKEKFNKSFNKITNLINKMLDVPNYWIFQFNPKQWDIRKKWDTYTKTEWWRVTAHKDKIKHGDKVILWMTGDESGCYALCEVISDVHFDEEEKLDVVELGVIYNLKDKPVLKQKLIDLPEFEVFYGGKQGTNYSATKAQYDKIIEFINTPKTMNKIWIYSPGRKAVYWDEFFENEIMAIGGKELGDLDLYQTKEKIVKELQKLEKTDGSKKNDATLAWDFVHNITPGDLIFVKNGRTELIGYGIVNSDYYYETDHEYPFKRKVNWIEKGTWTMETSLVLKTLTDLSPYPDYYEKILNLLGINRQGKKTFNPNIDLTKPVVYIPTQIINIPINLILFGPPGTGKTYNTINKALEIINEDEEKKLDWLDRKTVKNQFEERIKEGRIVFATFHQSMSYEDFIEGIKPIPPKAETNPVIYKIQDGIFKKIAIEASKIKQKTIEIDTETQVLTEELFDEFYFQFVETLVDSDEGVSNCILKTPEGNEFELFKNSAGSVTIKAGRKKTKMSASVVELKNVLFHGKPPTYKSYESKIINKILEEKAYKESPTDNSTKPFVLIIDEINRGNVSQIFGELITLIEEDKRIGKDEALEVTLPYSKEKFGVPSNLYIIGTMNTADRSVEAIDTALRRRFCFEEVPPRYDLKELKYEFVGIKGFEILRTLNKRIEKLLDKDHQIGHSYFMMKDSANLEEKLLTSIYKNIIPLLQEYFFGDFGKIGLVLGKGFIKMKEWDKNLDSFADFDYESSSEFADREVFGIIDYRKSQTSYILKIKDKEVQMDFQKAIKLLMKLDIE